MKNVICSILCCASALVFSCTSPNAIDTPRKTTYGNNLSTRLTVGTIDISLTSSLTNEATAYACNRQQAEIDTTDGLHLWLRGTCLRPASADVADLPLAQLTLAFDSLNIGAGDVRVMGNEGNTTGTSLLCYSALWDSTITIIPDDGFSEFTLDNIRHDRVNRTITFDLVLNIAPDARALLINGTCTMRY